MFNKEQEIEILEEANDIKMNLKKLKIKSFYAFHLCQYKCFQNLKNNADYCISNCEKGKTYFNSFKIRKFPFHNKKI